MPTLIYRERVLPSFGTFLWPAVVGVLLFATLLPLSEAGAWCAAVVVVFTFELLLVLRAPLILVTESELLVGRARIDRKHLGAASSINSEDAFAERGHRLDARAYTSFQTSIRTMVKVEISDSTDPTPYWLFSSRNSERLAELLG